MIRGILTFKPLADGSVQIMIKGKAEDIPELARLYGKEVELGPAIERATVQNSDSIILANFIEEVSQAVDRARYGSQSIQEHEAAIEMLKQ